MPRASIALFCASIFDYELKDSQLEAKPDKESWQANVQVFSAQPSPLSQEVIQGLIACLVKMMEPDKVDVEVRRRDGENESMN